ncbi:envelope glycoprotein N [Human betaherpesvirus 5]|uniref:Envelope glycoprotein N n=5 Tax=Human cytomegalovirus TaxID=10359 RepID=Q8JUG5_HCMV|nr:structural glycoprotein gpUL73 [Human betaherpesvirus 5]WNA12762.1 envelope glycoprotein N [Cytomegalovirus humanbeta5]AAO24841.1 envelope glycoprotein gpUL73 [Human betaherpesvirus 5]AAO24874.1 envelope glycoprotein gpUL73 [Human betaherpesvirus 5]ACS91998.1 envelope glycoprotein N [Human betaherpesvirus 5]
MEWKTRVLSFLVLSVAVGSYGNSSSTSTSASTPSPPSSSVSTVKSTTSVTTSTTPTTTTTTLTSTKPGSTTHNPNVMKRHDHDDFYNAHCTSHMYELSLSSFAAWWTMLNALILMGAFCIVLRHCCFQNFTATTTKGY